MSSSILVPPQPLGDAPQQPVDVHARLDVEPLIEAVLLLDDPDPLANSAPLGAQVEPEDRCAPRGGRQERREHLGGGGLSRAVRPQEAEHLRMPHLEGRVRHGHLVAELARQVSRVYREVGAHTASGANQQDPVKMLILRRGAASRLRLWST